MSQVSLSMTYNKHESFNTTSQHATTQYNTYRIVICHTCRIVSYNNTSGHITSCHVLSPLPLCHITSCHVALCHVKSRHVTHPSPSLLLSLQQHKHYDYITTTQTLYLHNNNTNNIVTSNNNINNKPLLTTMLT